MELMELPPMFIVLVVVVLVFVLVRLLSGSRRISRGEQRLCRACGASHPGFARFCRRCGREL